MAKEYKAADGTSYTLTLAGRRGEALERFWAEKASAKDTLSAFRGLKPAAAPSDEFGSAEKVSLNVEPAESPSVLHRSAVAGQPANGLDVPQDSPSGATKLVEPKKEEGK